MVKITEKNLEEKVSKERLGTMFEMANQMFEDVTHEWVDSHPYNIKQKYLIQKEADNKARPKPRQEVGFSLWSVKPVNGARMHELLIDVIDVYVAQNKVSVKNPKYFNYSIQLSKNY